MFELVGLIGIVGFVVKNLAIFYLGQLLVKHEALFAYLGWTGSGNELDKNDAKKVVSPILKTLGNMLKALAIINIGVKVLNLLFSFF